MAGRRRAPLAAIVAFAAVAAVAVIFLTRGLSGTEEGEAGQILATGSGQADPSLFDGGWVRIDLPGTAQLHEVWEVEGTLYAAGRLPRTGEAVLWRSQDGRDWRQVRATDGSFAVASINSMVVFDGEVLALGTRAVQNSDDDGLLVVPALWRSPTGEDFALSANSLTTDDPTATAGGGFLDVTISAGRLVAVGWIGSSVTLEGDGATRGAIWLSDDGLLFEPVGDQESVSATSTAIREVAVNDQSGIIAAGESEGLAVIWQSANGEEWAVLARGDGQAEGAGGWSADTLALGPNGIRSFGIFRPDAAEASARGSLVWSGSEDWMAGDAAAFGGAAIAGLAADGVGYVVVGEMQVGNAETTGAVWASRDGETWSRVLIEGMSPGASRATGVAMFDRGVAVVGAAYAQPAIWFRQAGDLDEDQPVAAAGPLALPAWATVFQEQTPSGASPVSVFSVGGRIYGFAADRVIWTSDDGREWSPAFFSDVGLDDALAITSIVQRAGLFVAIGEADGIGLWRSSDGDRWERPDSKLPCCPEAIVADAFGFTALFAAGDSWLLAGSVDGIDWTVVDEDLEFPLQDLWQSAFLGPTWFVWGSGAGGEDIRLWESVDNGVWVEAVGPDGIFATVAWEGVWQFDDRIVAAGRVGARTVVFTTLDGLTWTMVPVSEVEQAPAVRDVAPIPNGLAMLLVLEGQRLVVSQVVGGQVQDLVPLSPEEGFGGLRAVLVPDTDALRAVGPDHGRMTVWEWIP